MDDTTTAVSEKPSAEITDEGIARMRERIGVLVPQPAPFNIEASIDGFRHFATGYGDDNPLFCDESHGQASRWGSVIGAPLFVMTMGASEIKTIRPELKERGAHALAGVHEFFSGDDWEFLLPVKPGDRMTKRYYLCAVEEREKSAMGGGRSVMTRYRADFTNQRGEIVAIERFNYVRIERDAARKSGKHASVPPALYTDAEIDEIDAAYARQAPPRGSEKRYWEDVQVGDELPTLPKGPLTVTDTIVWMRGWGASVQSNRLAWKHRQRMPKFFTRNAHNAWDPVMRVHWDENMAREVGNPAPYDFGRMRSAFLSNVVTHWMGDDAWLWRMSSQYRVFNYVGDTQWVKGRVTGKSVENGHHVVDIDIRCENQRGEITAPGTARVILPTKSGGDARLPVSEGSDDVALLW